MKTLFRKFLRSQGYDICRLDRVGASAFRDLTRIYGKHHIKMVFDVGANEGQTTKSFLNTFRKAIIHSFEPCETTFKELSRAVSGSDKVRLVNCALGNITGNATLQINTNSQTNSLLANSPEAVEFQPPGTAVHSGHSNVILTTFDSYCSENEILFVDLLKLDTQGFELQVLQGADQSLSEGRVGAIYSEMLFVPLYANQAYFDSVYMHLFARGFRLVHLYDCSMNRKGYISWCDALFINPEVLDKHLQAIQA